MKTLLLILLTSLSCLGQERVVLIHYNSHLAKVIHQRIVNKKVLDTVLAEIESDTLFIFSKRDSVLALLDKKKHPKYKAIKLITK